MDWKDLGKKIAAFGAPILGGAIGGPGGAAIGTAVAGLFGADPKDPEDVLKKLISDPEAILKLKRFEAENEREILKIYMADVHSARQREVEVTKATGGTNWPIYALAGVVLVGFFALVSALFFKTIPEGSKEAAYMLFGALSGSFSGVVQYFFGSSKGSSDKNAAIFKGTGK